MVLINTEKGKCIFSKLLSESKIWYNKFPLEIALKNNGNLVHPTKLRLEREQFFDQLQKEEFGKVVKSFLSPKRKWIFDTYYNLPKCLRKLIRKLMDKRMKYE